MLTVTQPALQLLVKMLDLEGVSDEAAVRLVTEREGVAMRSDNERPGDATFQCEGRTVLIMDANVSEMLSESTLDCDGTGFSLKHPELEG